MRIPFSKPYLFGSERKYVIDAINSTWISGGKYIENLEQGFNNLFSGFTSLVSNGTAALHLAYLAGDLGSGDKVIIPGFGFQAAANVALQLGIDPIFVDVDLDTFLMSPEKLEVAILKNLPKNLGMTAIVVIHSYGYTCDMDAIMALANRYDCLLIEDCAESIFSMYNNNYCGTFGTMGTYSFQATKTITTGEGGAIFADSEYLNDYIKLYRSHGLATRGTYDHIVPGHNFRMTNMQAAFGLAQFKNLNTILLKKHDIEYKYIQRLSNQDGIILHKDADNTTRNNCLWSFPIRIDKKVYKGGRDFVIAELLNSGIETRPGFVSASHLPYLFSDELPNSEVLENEILVLPSYITDNLTYVDIVCDALLKLR